MPWRSVEQGSEDHVGVAGEAGARHDTDSGATIEEIGSRIVVLDIFVDLILNDPRY